MRSKCLETGLESSQLIIDLDFTSISGEVPPALRNPPEFEVLPASIFWNREEDKVRITFTTTIELYHFIFRSNFLKSVI